MVTVAASHTVPFGAGRQTVYVNWSTPVKPGAGVYVYVPFDENTQTAVRRIARVVEHSTRWIRVVALHICRYRCIVWRSRYVVIRQRTTTIVTVAGSHSVPFGAGRHT
jgi:hypothetical protein